MPREPAGVAYAVHLFVMLWLAATAGLSWWSASRDELISVLHLALFVHIGLSLGLGVSGTARTTTWLVLIAAFVAAHAATFLDYVLPWGQARFWLAGALAQLVGAPAAEAIGGSMLEPSKLWPTIGLVAVGADVVAMQGPVCRKRPLPALLFAVAAVATAIVLAFALEPLPAPRLEISTEASFAILPAWHALPFYAILRTIPDKVDGVVIMFAAMLAPIVWPWAGVEKLRAGRQRWWWRLACAITALAWASLWYLGAKPPIQPWLTTAVAMTVVWFGFILSPFVLSRIDGRA